MNALSITQFLDSPGSPFLSPKKVAQGLHLQVNELAESAHVHRNTLTARPQSPKLQELLRAYVRVISAATEAFGDRATAVTWIRNEAVPAFRHKTPLELVNEGRIEAVLSYLDSIESGFVG